jgi:hypothetical protein
MIKTLLPKRNANATIVGTTSCIINLDSAWLVGNAAYAFTKIAFTKAMDVFAAEIPDCHFVTFHPGTGKCPFIRRSAAVNALLTDSPVDTEMLEKSAMNVSGQLPLDDREFL